MDNLKFIGRKQEIATAAADELMGISPEGDKQKFTINETELPRTQAESASWPVSEFKSSEDYCQAE